MKAATSPWRLASVGTYVRPMRWMLAVQALRSAQSAQAAKSAQTAR